MPSFPLLVSIVLVGIGATAVMDVWLLILSRLGVPTAGFAMVGRWAGHFARGRFVHAAIAKAAPVPFENALGWLTHYLVGIAYAALLPSGSSQSNLYSINLLTGAATNLGQIDGGVIITAISVVPAIPEPATLALAGMAFAAISVVESLGHISDSTSTTSIFSFSEKSSFGSCL